MKFNNRFVSLVFIGLLVGATACAVEAPEGDDVGEDSEAAAKARAKRPADSVDPFPSESSVRSALDLYGRDKGAARAADPMSVPEFFGEARPSSNEAALRIERLRPGRSYDGKPIAFLSAKFHDTDTYWNNRYKDVQVERLLNWSGYGLKTVAPEAAHFPSEGRALIRIWNEYRPFSKGAPDGLTGDALRGEIARALIASYVAGNVDGPASNANNGGFAKIMLPSGRSVWRGVIIDCGACWNSPAESHQPWKSVVMGEGIIKRQIPEDVFPALVKIAEATRGQLLEASRMDRGPDSERIVEAERIRARQVLDHYGVAYRAPGS